MAKAKKTDELSALELQALKIAGKQADDRRDDLDVATGQSIDLTVRITGAISVGADQDFASDLKPQLADVLAVALSTLGPRIRKELARDLETAYELAPEGESPAVHTDHRLAADRLIAKLTRRSEKHRRGNVVGSLKLEKLS